MLYTKSVLLRNIEGLHMFQQKWRRWIADQGCQFGIFKARIWNTFGYFWKSKRHTKFGIFWLFSVEKV